MPLPAALPIVILIGLACAGGLYYAVVLWRIIRTRQTLPTTLDGLGLPAPAGGGGWPHVCIIIPAHNEESIIGTLARSLARQDYPNLRIVFTLDRCTDGTERIIRESMAGNAPPFEIIHVHQCPDGWAGKTHALWRGVQDSGGARGADMLLFADADTEFEPALVRASVALLIHRRLDLLSLLSRLTCTQWFERTVQPAAGFELVRQYPLDIVNREVRPRAFANGQFMLFRRDLYDRIGGHERVKGELLEDIALARHLDIVRKTMPSRWGVLLTGGMLRCRMYADWDSFRRGWKRIYTEASGRRPKQLREWARRKVFSGVILPLSGVACAAAGPLVLALGDRPLGFALLIAGLGSLGAFLAAMTLAYRDQGVPLRYVPTYPAGAWRVSRLLAEAARDLDRGVKTVWAGREYAREAR